MDGNTAQGEKSALDAREDKVRSVMAGLKHLAMIRRQCETAVRKLPAGSAERKRMRAYIFDIDSTVQMASGVVDRLEGSDPGFGSVFRMAYIDNLTNDAIANMLGISKRTVIRRRNRIVSAIAADDELYTLFTGGESNG